MAGQFLGNFYPAKSGHLQVQDKLVALWTLIAPPSEDGWWGRGLSPLDQLDTARVCVSGAGATTLLN
jgi:hypothetical protein